MGTFKYVFGNFKYFLRKVSMAYLGYRDNEFPKGSWEYLKIFFD